MKVILDSGNKYRATVFGDVVLADEFSIVEIPNDTVGLHDGCVWSNGVMTGCIETKEHSFEVVSDRSDSIAEDAALEKRRALLIASDWTQLPDVPETTKVAWAAYRQALRDITSQLSFPKNITWPTLPANIPHK